MTDVLERSRDADAAAAPAPLAPTDDAPAPDPTFALRPYQAQMVEQAVYAVRNGRKPGLVLPTGGGKTAVMAGIIRKLMATASGPVLILQDRGALAVQNGPKIGDWLGLTHSRVGGGKESWDGQVVMAMRQSAAKVDRLETIAETDWGCVLVDEAHRLGSGEYDKIVEVLPPQIPLIGLSATLARADGRPLSPLDHVIEGPSIESLIENGFLTPYRFLVPKEAIQGRIKRGVAEMKTVAGEYSAADAARLLNTGDINAAVVRQTRKKFLNRKDRKGQGLVAFCATIQHAEDLVEAYRAAGEDARTYHSRMSQFERDETLAAFDAGEFPVLVNPLALGEGFDCARVGAVVILRPCAHRSTFVQIVGRGLRVAHERDYPGVDKRDCIVFDYAAAVTRHRSLDCPPSIDGVASESRAVQDALKDCPRCATVMRRTESACPECGYVFTGDEPDVDPVVAEELVVAALSGSARRRWLQVAPQAYVVNDRDVTALMLDLLDGTYLVFGAVEKRRGRRASLKPVARAVSAEAARAAAEAFVAREVRDAAPGPAPADFRLWWHRTRGRDIPDAEALHAVDTARGLLRTLARKHADLDIKKINLDAVRTLGPAVRDDS